LTNTGTYASGSIWLLLPAAGSLIFVLMHIMATLYYPGGSQADKAAKGWQFLFLPVSTIC
jgi:hypothetical protein